MVITSVAVPSTSCARCRPSAGSPTEPFLYAASPAPTYARSAWSTSLLLRWLRDRTGDPGLVQFVGDLLLITGLVYYFGGIASPFSMLYLVVITVAATLLSQRAAIVLANLALTFYAALIVAL